MEQPEFIEIEVDPRTREKLIYLKNIMDGFAKIAGEFDVFRAEKVRDDRVVLERKVYWNTVANYLAPDVILVTSTGSENHKNPFSGAWETPKFAIIKSGAVIDLDRHFVLSTKENRQRAKSDARDRKSVV